MHTKIYSKNSLQKLATRLFDFGMMAGLATLTFGLISCGGGGGGGGSTTTSTGSTTSTISNIVPVGIVASSVPQSLSIAGTNFASGMTVTVSDSLGVEYTVTSASVTSATVMTANVTIPSAPTDRFVTVTIRSSAGTALASAVLGVAGARKTIAADIQPIFDNNLCYSCHGTSGGLNLSSAISSSTGLIEAPSIACSQKLRVTAGDPRRTSSVLIDVLKAKSTTAALSCNSSTTRHMPQGTYPALTVQEIQDIVDWVAGGAN